MTRYISYCRHCVMPETKPDIFIDAGGVCNACRSFMGRKEVDWNTRRGELLNILERYRSKNSGNYDCVVPVS